MRSFGTLLLTSLSLTLAVALLGAAPTARADSDPASDVLVGQQVYYPYSPPTSPALSRVLDKVTAVARRARYPIKVALIGSPDDLGAVGQLFGQPQRYAGFLGSEITFNGRQPLLVVMPGGYGTYQAGPRAAEVVGGLAKPTGADGDALARAAAVALPRLAAAAGHPVPAAALPSDAGVSGGGKGGGAPPWWVFALPVVLLGGLVALLTRRRGGARGEGVESRP